MEAQKGKGNPLMEKGKKDIDQCGIRVIHLERVREAQKNEIEELQLNRLHFLFKALSDPTRLRIVLALHNHEMCVCDLAAALDLTESAISHQLRHLREQSLIKGRRDGQIVYYSLDDDHVSQLLTIGLAHSREGR